MSISLNSNKPGNQKAILLALLGVALVLVVLVAIDLMRKPSVKEPVVDNSVPLENQVQEPVAYEDVLAMDQEKKDEFNISRTNY